MAKKLTKKQFLLDVPKILDGTMEITDAHAIIFLKRLGKGVILAEREGSWGDHIDYAARCYALFDDVGEEAELEALPFLDYIYEHNIE